MRIRYMQRSWWNWRLNAALLAVLSIASACAPARAPVPELPDPVAPSTPRVADPDSVDVPVPSVSSFRYASGVYRYEVVTESAIRQPGDSADAEAHVRTASFVTMRLDRLSGDSLSVRVNLDSVLAERDSLVPAPDSTNSAAPLFSTLIDSRGMPLDGVELSDQECSAGDRSELLAVARDLLLELPLDLRVGAMWSDTSTVTICRGGVPVTSGVVRFYEVLDTGRDADGRPLMRISRTTAFSLAGTQTTEYGQVIALSGNGDSRSMLELDLLGGRVRSATREGTSAVTVTYGRTSTPFTQRVVQRIRLLETEGDVRNEERDKQQPGR